MARLLVTAKIMPTNVEVDLENIYRQLSRMLPEEYEVRDFKIVPIAFGLKALLVNILMPEDKVGGTSELENIILKMENVRSIEVMRITRIL